MPELAISTRSDTQVLLLDSKLQVVQRGVGALTADVPAGLYKIKLERGGATKEQLLELTANQSISLFIDAFPAIAPIGPLLGQDSERLERMAQEAMPEFPDGVPPGAPLPEGTSTPGVLVLAHRSRGDGAGRDPLDGLRIAPFDASATWRQKLVSLLSDPALHRLPIARTVLERGWQGGLLERLPPFLRRLVFPEGEARTLSALPPYVVEIGDEVWRAAWLPLAPGCHVLEIADGGQTVLQSVLVAPNWQTRLFVRRSRWRSGAPTTPDEARRRDWIDISIQMAQPAADVVYSDHFETVEVARNALELGRPIFVASDLIESLLQDKFDNPVMGLTGLHLFLEAVEWSRAPQDSDSGRELRLDPSYAARADEIAREVIANLTRLLCGEGKDALPPPSDLIALKLRAGLLPATPRTLVREPPMLWASWDLLRRASGPDRPIEIAPELWRRIAWGNAWGPYLAWPPRLATVKRYVRSHGAARRPADATALPHLEGKELAEALHIPESMTDRR